MNYHYYLFQSYVVRVLVKFQAQLEESTTHSFLSLKIFHQGSRPNFITSRSNEITKWFSILIPSPACSYIGFSI